MALRGRRARRLVGLAAVLTLAWHAVLFATSDLLPPLAPAWFPDLGAVVVNLAAALVPLAVVVRLHWWRSAAVAWRTPDRSWWLVLPMLLPVVADAVTGVRGTTVVLVSSALLLTSVGFSEELLSRGVVQRIVTPLGSAWGAVAVGALFGLGHALSGAWFGRGFENTAYQVVEVGFWGFAMAALRWHLGTIWPLVVVHAIDDWFQLNSPERRSDAVQLATALGEIAYGVVLLRLLAARRALSGGIRPGGRARTDEIGAP